MKNKFQNIFNVLGYVYVLFLLVSCKKDWLEAKPEMSLAIPKNTRDYQAMLDNNSNGTAPFNVNSIGLGEVGAGDFFILNSSWPSIGVQEKNLYTWAADIYGQTTNFSAWEFSYNNIFYSNVILEGIDKISPKNSSDLIEANQVKGSAHFFRAYRHYDIAQNFCKPYERVSSNTDLGIPLRLQSDINILSVRSSIEETYRQIISDLNLAATLLPVEKPNSLINKFRPTKVAAYAMLARVYLSMGLYDSSNAYANKALALYNVLQDYNSIPNIGFYRMQRFNEEVIFYMVAGTPSILAPFTAIIDSNLYRSYDNNDLRKNLFFYNLNGNFRFVGSYDQGNLFTGLATDELYLIRAECEARLGNKIRALSDLNALIAKRWSNLVSYNDISAVDANEALVKVLAERRKELCFRCLRWSDLRRLNTESQTAVTLNRVIQGSAYTLEPNSKRYILPIPPNVISLTGMVQNPR